LPQDRRHHRGAHDLDRLTRQVLRPVARQATLELMIERLKRVPSLDRMCWRPPPTAHRSTRRIEKIWPSPLADGEDLPAASA